MSKYFLLLIALFSFLFACEQPAKPPAPAEAPQALPPGPKTLSPKTLKNYFLPNNILVEAPASAWLPANSAEFSRITGVARVIGANVETPNFNTDFVAVLATPATNRLTDIHVSKIEELGDSVNVYFDVAVGGEMTWKMQPALIFTFPRNGAVKTVHFYHGNALLKSLPSAMSELIAVDTSFRSMPAFFIKKDVKVAAPLSCWVIGDVPTFNKQMGMPVTPEGDGGRAPDFAKELVLVVAAPESNKSAEIRIDKVETSGSSLNVTFSMRSGGEQSAIVWPAAVAAVPREGIKTVNFFNGMKKVKSVPVH